VASDGGMLEEKRFKGGDRGLIGFIPLPIDWSV
jgi:hypothetical protein